jgi:hypothetical protein
MVDLHPVSVPGKLRPNSKKRLQDAAQTGAERLVTVYPDGNRI